MKPISSYISEKLFTDMDNQIKETDEFILKQKIIELAHIKSNKKININKNKIDIISDNINAILNDIIIYQKEADKFPWDIYKFGYIDNCCMFYTNQTEGPEYFENTTFDSFYINYHALNNNKVIFSNWYLNIKNRININSNVDFNLKNFNINTKSNKITLNFSVTDYKNSDVIINILNNLNIDNDNNIKHIIINNGIKIKESGVDIKYYPWFKEIKKKFKNTEIYLSSGRTILPII